MGLRNKIRKKYGNSNTFVNAASFLVNEFFCLISLVSPKWNAKLRYRYNYKEKLNIKTPSTFIEKCNWYKINIVNKNEIFRTCSDKYLVRNYIKSVGCGELLNELYGVYDRVKDIDWDALPDQFVIKINDGCGYYIICDNKDTFDITQAKKKLKKWWKEHRYLLYGEKQNKARKRRIVIEKYIHGENGEKQPTDYKIYCFNGEPTAILTVWDRNSKLKELFMSTNWEFLSFAMAKPGVIKSKPDSIPRCPANLKEMLDFARKLSSGFPFVRVDFYQSDVGPVFGELTFTCAGGIFTSQTDPDVLDMSKLFNVPCEFNKTFEEK